MKSALSLSVAALLMVCGSAFGQTSNGVTQHTSYMVPSDAGSGVIFKSFATTLNNEIFTRTSTGANDYRLVGVPDGQGAFRTAQDIQNGTFTLLVNHEIDGALGVVRAHGNRGSFVSKWTVRTSDLTVVSADDSSTQYKLWDIANNQYNTYNTANPMPTYSQAAGVLPPGSFYGTQGWNPSNPDKNGITRFCSGDLAPTSAFSFGGLGTTDRLYLAGEERGASGRVFAHVASGSESGTTYELPRLGDFSWENAVASPVAQQKTVVIGLDDSTPGGVYLYVGNKQSTGSVVDKAGLTNGNLYGITVPGISVTAGQPLETRTNVLGNTTRVESARFGLHNFNDVSAVPGTQFTNPNNSQVTTGVQQIGDANGVVNFLRPEDGAWDTKRDNRFYFVTTDNTTANGGRSRLWSMDFDDITNPTNGGQITMLAEGGNASSLSGGIASATAATTFEMADNICVTKNGYVLIQEDVGNNARLGRLWLYDPNGDNMVEIGISDATRFQSGLSPSTFLTQDEETSGIIDASDILGDGWFLLNMQAHYGTSTSTGTLDTELAEGGQLMALYIPATIPAPGAAALLGLGGLIASRRRRNA